jgi:hypothetical protein
MADNKDDELRKLRRALLKTQVLLLSLVKRIDRIEEQHKTSASS